MASNGSVTHLFDAAKAVRERAHAPYSNFRVGAALRSSAGIVYAGCNVENASYPEGWCAETSAIAQLIAAGDRQIEEVVVVAGGDRLCTPCGGCRQRLAEFAGPETIIHAADLNGILKSFKMRDLLPEAFVLVSGTDDKGSGS